VAIVSPSGLNLIDITAPLCPMNLNGLYWGLKFHTYTTASLDAEATCLLEFLKKGLRVNEWNLCDVNTSLDQSQLK
jgi:hypothetical protein